MPKAETTVKRITAASVVTRILLSKKVPTDAEIVAQVKKETGSKSFNAAQLSWYKTKARNGGLIGQTGKKYVIAQAQSKTIKAGTTAKARRHAAKTTATKGDTIEG